MKKLRKATIDQSLFSISKRQKDILLLLYRFRFLHSKHLQYMLKQQTHSRMRAWLNNLTKKDFIGEIYDPTRMKGRMPTVYYLGKNGLSFIRYITEETSYGRKLWNEETPRFSLKNHCLAIADLAIAIATYCKEKDLAYSLYTKAELATLEDYTDIQPDLLVQLANKAYFIELDRETESESKMYKKIYGYLRHFNNDTWHKFSQNIYPAIIVITLSPARINKLQSFCEHLLREAGYPPVIIKFTTIGQIQNKGLRHDICTVVFKSNEQFLFI